MHPLAVFLIIAPVYAAIFAVSLTANLLLTWLAGWRKRAALAAVWGSWMALAIALHFVLDDFPFSFDIYAVELIIAAIGFVPAMPGAWLGARLNRRRRSLAQR